MVIYKQSKTSHKKVLKKKVVSNKPIQILYEDSCSVVFYKPAGLLVIPSPKNENQTLVDIVNEQYGKAHNQNYNFHPCHRLDRETSGAILFAKGKSNQKKMMDLFASRSVHKKYVAFVHGYVARAKGVFKSVIRDVDQRKFARHSSGKEAITHYCVIEQKKDFAVVEVSPETGRTNQIRIHFSKAKNPLIGDRKYAFARDYKIKFRRTALHAQSLEWVSLESHEKVRVEAPWPVDMKQFLEKKK